MKTLYINQSCMFSLFDRPLAPNNCLRKAVAPIFKSKKCFEDMRKSIYDYYRINENIFLKHKKDYEKNKHKWISDSDIAPCPVTKAPFILDLGQICFNTRSVYDLDYAYERQWFAFSLSNSSAYWRDEKKNYKDFCNIHDLEVFGYMPKLEDQRMNFIYFELNPPLRFRIYNIINQPVGVGKLFIHIYPTGHISLNIAVSYIRCDEITTKYHLDSVIRELKPWKKNSELVIHSKFGKTSLNELVKIVLSRISHSFFSIEKTITHKLDWNCSALIISDNINKELRNIVDYVDYENEFKRKVYLRDMFSFDAGYVNEYIYAKGGFLFYLTEIKRKGIIHSFWRTQRLKEFIEYKKIIYHSYVSYFKNETLRIKKIQYGNISPEKIFGKNFYQSDIAAHISALDQMVNHLSPEERALYSYISDVYNFDNHRERLLSSLNEWESQIKEWKDKEPKILSLLEIILKPFELFF